LRRSSTRCSNTAPSAVIIAVDFYQDVILSEPAVADLPLGAHYHAWTPETIAHLWSIWASNRFLRAQFYPSAYYEALVDEARPYLGTPSVVADIGCGSGTVLSVLRQRQIGARLLGVDLSEASIATLRARWSGDPSVGLQVGSITGTGLPDGSCDLVVCTETLEHLFPADFGDGLAEIARVLVPGGRLLASVPLEERPNFVVCPECHAIFTPYQHMLFNFTIRALSEALDARGLEIAHVIHPIDTGVPRRAWKRFVKDRVLRPWFPGLSRRLFRVAGVSGFVARKRV
jgi:SAM-dependent methyltransferase